MREDGTWQRIVDALRRKVRTAAGRDPTPRAAYIDSQAAEGTEVGGVRGYDGGKRIDGRKRHFVVDSLGLLMAVLVTAASADDGAAAPQLLGQLDRHRPLLPEPVASPRGGPEPVPNRPVVEGILRVLRNGGRRKALPQGYPSPSTCWRRLAEWEERGVWLEAWRTFLDELNAEGRIRWEECFADGSFDPAKKGDPESARRRGARARSGWWWSMVKEFRWHVT